MGFLQRICGKAPGDANAALARALATAECVKSMDDIADDLSKRLEMVGVILNLKAATKALSSGKDDQGCPISASQISDGLQAMLNYMRDGGIWFRLHANASRATRASLDALESDLQSAATALQK